MRIAVYLGSSRGRDPKYMEAAQETGRRLAQSGIGVVFGGAGVGTMKALSDGVAQAGGECIGVFPRGFKGKPEVAASGVNIHDCPVTREILVKDFAERKATMGELSDCCVALPGSWGTLDELFTYATETQLGFNGGKPLFVLNLDGYYDSLVSMVEKMYVEGFIYESSYHLLTFVPTVDALIEKVTQYAAEMQTKK